MLSNAFFLAKFRFDTAENEPAKICKILLILSSFANVARDAVAQRAEERRLPRGGLVAANQRPGLLLDGGRAAEDGGRLQRVDELVLREET